MEKTIKTRQFLREFASIKEALLVSDVQTVYVPVAQGKRLKITMEKEQTPFERVLEIVRKNKFPLIKRPDLDLFTDK